MSGHMPARVRSIAVLAIVVGGCTSPKATSSSAPTVGAGAATESPSDVTQDKPSRRPIALPDLSSATASVVKQIRGRHASLTRTLENPTATAKQISDAYGEMGKLFMAARYLESAEACFLSAHALAPDEIRWPYYLGHLHRNKGELPEAAAFFEKVLQLPPDDVATRVWLGDVYLRLGRPDAAESVFAKALMLQPRAASALFGLGRSARARGDDVGAVKYLEEALSLNPSGAGIHYPLAMAYRALGNHEQAKAHLRQRADVDVLPEDPLMEELEVLLDSSVAYELRGTQALKAGNWAAAASLFRRGVELAPGDPSLRHRLGTALSQLGDVAGAKEQFEMAVRVSPQYARARYSLGVLWESSGGHLKEATDQYVAAIKSEPSYLEARLRLAAIYRREGRFQESLAQYDHVLQIDPRVSEARFGGAMAAVALRRYATARDRLSQGVNDHPDEPAFAHALARLLAAAPDGPIRDGRRAMAVMQKLSNEQQRLDFGETMAMAMAEVGEYTQAVAWQHAAIDAAAVAGHGDLAQRMAQNLRLYEQGKPCRVPWRDGELP